MAGDTIIGENDRMRCVSMDATQLKKLGQSYDYCLATYGSNSSLLTITSTEWEQANTWIESWVTIFMFFY